MHYLPLRPEDDSSGVRMTLTESPTPLSAGMVSFASAFEIPPGRPSTLVPNECCYSGFEPLHGFGFRVHAHWMGRCARAVAAGGGPVSCCTAWRRRDWAQGAVVQLG